MRGYLRVGSLAGEAQDVRHEGWSVIRGMSSAVRHQMNAAAHSETTRGIIEVEPITVIKETDAATIKLQRALLSRACIGKVEIEFCNMLGGSRQVFLAYELENVFITEFKFAPFEIRDDAINTTESVTFRFAKVRWTYFTFDQGNGALVGRVSHEYELGRGR